MMPSPLSLEIYSLRAATSRTGRYAQIAQEAQQTFAITLWQPNRALKNWSCDISGKRLLVQIVC